jgi:hippurate hydrolase
MNVVKQAIEWRHTLHQHPEFGFEEEFTSDFIAKTLESYGIEVHRNIGKTGLVGIMKKGDSERSIGLRADFDALKIHEKNTCDHRSKIDGMMHGCGHDGHTAMLLGAAAQLSQSTDFNGTVYFIFQPAEELGTGAKAMIDDGLFTRWRIDSIFAMHNMPGIELGSFLISPSSIMAAENHFKIEIFGLGGHAAMPHLGSDPLITACNICTALQSIITRDLDSIHEPAVLSVTNIETNGGANVIPTTVTLSGDTRCFSDTTQEKIKAKIERVVAGHCASTGLQYSYEFSNCVLSTVNDPEQAEVAAQVAQRVAGVVKVNTSCKPYCTSEDFSFMQRQVPSCYLLIGNGVAGQKGGTALHLPTYDFNDDLLITGIQFWGELVKEKLSVN